MYQIYIYIYTYIYIYKYMDDIYIYIYINILKKAVWYHTKSNLVSTKKMMLHEKVFHDD